MKELNTIMVVGTVQAGELKTTKTGKYWIQFELINGKNKITCKTFKDELARQIHQCDGAKVLVQGSLNAEPFHNEQYNKDFINPFIDVDTFTEFTEENVNHIGNETKTDAAEQQAMPDFDKVQENLTPLADGEDLPF